MVYLNLFAKHKIVTVDEENLIVAWGKGRREKLGDWIDIYTTICKIGKYTYAVSHELYLILCNDLCGKRI